MKKAFISFLSIIIFSGMVTMASAFGPALDPDGSWTELYSGGGSGQSGNSLSAVSYSYVNPSWSLSGMTLDQIIDSLYIYNGPHIPDNIVGMEYVTKYKGGILLWGSSVINGLEATVTADIIDDDYAGGFIDLTGSGGFSMSGELREMGFTVSAPGHFGDIYITSVTGLPVPEPATMLLLGLGLMGIAGIRRKFKG